MLKVEERFIRTILEDSGRRILADQTLAIQSRTVTRTGNLLNNRFLKVQGTEAIHDHPVYERFLDMKTGMVNGKVIRRVPRPIHNRFLFGYYSNVASRLSAEFTEEVARQLKQEIMSNLEKPIVING